MHPAALVPLGSIRTSAAIGTNVRTGPEADSRLLEFCSHKPTSVRAFLSLAVGPKRALRLYRYASFHSREKTAPSKLGIKRVFFWGRAGVI